MTNNSWNSRRDAMTYDNWKTRSDLDDRAASIEPPADTNDRIGTCDCCGKENQELYFTVAYGIDTDACGECCGQVCNVTGPIAANLKRVRTAYHAMCDALDAVTEPNRLRTLLDDADAALDAETWPQNQAHDHDAPDAAQFTITAGTLRKVNRLIAELDANLKGAP